MDIKGQEIWQSFDTHQIDNILSFAVPLRPLADLRLSPCYSLRSYVRC